MRLVGAGLLLVLCAAGSALLVPLAPSAQARAYASGTLTCLVGLGGVAAGAGALPGPHLVGHGASSAAAEPGDLAVDPLSGLFLFLIGAVAVAAGVYSIGYPPRRARSGTMVWSSRARDDLADRAGGAAAVRRRDAAGPGGRQRHHVPGPLGADGADVAGARARRAPAAPEVGQAGVWYAAMTHAGFVAILLGSGGRSRGRGRQLSPSPASGTAAAGPVAGHAGRWCSCWPSSGSAPRPGMVPLHVWLPRAHPEAPSHVSALMSAAMVNLGCTA